MPRIQIPVYQMHERNGDVASGAKLYFYENRSNPPVLKPVYLDAAQTIAMQNPVTLAADAYTPDVYGAGAYTIVLRDQHGAQLWARDDVAITGTDGGQYSDWSPIDLYQEGAIVRDAGSYFISLVPNNIGNQPSVSPEQWTEIAFIKYWNANEVYREDDIVVHNGALWYSAVPDNQGNEPTLDDQSFWLPPFAQNITGSTFDYSGTTTSGDKTIAVTATMFRLGRLRTLQGTAEITGGGASLDGDIDLIAALEAIDEPPQLITGTLTSSSNLGAMALLASTAVKGRFEDGVSGGDGSLSFSAQWFI